MDLQGIQELLGDKFQSLIDVNPKISRDLLTLPGPDVVDRVFAQSNRSPQVLCSLQRLYNTGRLRGTGYVSILPVDQGLEHTGGASFAPNPIYFDPAQIVELAIEGGCNGVASSFGVLASVSRRYAHKIPFIVKFNHNELLTYPNRYNQVPFGSAEAAWNLGAAGIGATIYFGAPEAERQIQEVAEAFEEAHSLGMFTVLWAYLRNSAFKHEGTDYHAAADMTGQAVHIASTLQADIVKQKLATNDGGFKAIGFGKYSDRMYDTLLGEHPVDLARYQVLNCYAGRIGLINSGGASGENDLQQAVQTALVNKLAGGAGLISGRKAFQKPMSDGVELLNAIQDVYLVDTLRPL